MSQQRQIWWLRLTENVIVFSILALVGVGAYFLIFETDIQFALTVTFTLLTALLLLLLVLQSFLDHVVQQVFAVAQQNDDEKFKSLYERSPTALITTDASGKINACNQSAVHLFRSARESLLGANLFSFILEHDGHDDAILSGKLRSGVTILDEQLLIQAHNAEEIWVLLSAYEDRETKQRIISLTDVTKAKQVDNAKSEFLALATHQLGTPIAAIRWHADLLQKKTQDAAFAQVRGHVDKILRNTRKMVSLVDDFLSVSKLEMGTFAAQKEMIRLSDYFNDVIDEFAEPVAQKALTISREYQQPSAVFKTDTRLFHIIVSNLISNAVKYSTPQGQLRVYFNLTPESLTIQIADTGIGIPKKELSQLFQKFFRASNAQAHQTQGTGLGLYMVKRSVEQLDGTVSVESVENQHTTFMVVLPM